MSILLILGFIISSYLGYFFNEMTPEETKIIVYAFRIALIALILSNE